MLVRMTKVTSLFCHFHCIITSLFYVCIGCQSSRSSLFSEIQLKASGLPADESRFNNSAPGIVPLSPPHQQAATPRRVFVCLRRTEGPSVSFLRFAPLKSRFSPVNGLFCAALQNPACWSKVRPPTTRFRPVSVRPLPGALA